MSKHSSHKHHHTEENNTNNTSQIDTGNQSSMQELSKMLNNVDMSQLSSILASLNLNSNGENNEQKIDTSNKDADNNNINNSNTNVQLLNSLRPFLSPQKVEMLDKIIQIYSKVNATK